MTPILLGLATAGILAMPVGTTSADTSPGPAVVSTALQTGAETPPGRPSSTAALSGANGVAVPNPWYITDRVTVTQPMEVGDVIVAGSGELIVEDVPEPGFSVTGDLWVVQSGRAELRNSVIRFMNTYHGQYSLVAGGDATVLVEGCDYRVPNHVHHGLLAVENASLTLRDTGFDPVQLVVLGDGRLLAQRLDGQFEIILQDRGDITLEDIPRNPGGGNLWVWPTFPGGSQAGSSHRPGRPASRNAAT